MKTVETLQNERIPQQLLGRDIVFFDGSCVLCHKMVEFVLRVDLDKHFLLCSQQSEIGHLVLERHSINVDDLSTIYVVKSCGSEKEQVLSRSSAILYILSSTKGIWALLGILGAIVPRAIGDFAYNCVAHNRYKIFGKTNEMCKTPTPEDRLRIIG